MCRTSTARALVAALATIPGCGGNPRAASPEGAPTPAASPAPASVVAPSATIATAPLERAVPSPACAPADWSAQELAPLLKPGKSAKTSEPDRPGSEELRFAPECTDGPDGPPASRAAPLVVDGVELRVVSAAPAGSSGRGWAGNQCVVDVRLADGAGAAVRLGAREIPPFNTIGALVRSGSAAWISISFNGYTAEFPQGGNRILALDLCDGRVVWQSSDSTSNGGLLLYDDYLIAPYGFTRERRFVFVFDARSGRVVQKLPVVENVCPSASWAPNWRPGERCDAPGQTVGAAKSPRVEGGVFLVDTNTGSSAFQLR